MAGGSITVRKDITGTLAVTITCQTGATASFYSDAALTSAVSFPDSITADKTYYTGSDDTYVVSVKRNGYELAADPDGAQAVHINGGKAYSFAPAIDPLSASATGEVGAGSTLLYHMFYA